MEVVQLSYKHIIQDFSFDFLPGKCYLVMGPNGAGKSTLLHLLAGLIKPTSGKFFGLNHQHDYFNEKNRVVLLQKKLHDVLNLTVEEVVAMGRFPFIRQESWGLTEQKTAQQLSTWKIEHLSSRRYHTLSGGEQQRVHLARVWNQLEFTVEHGVFLIDEPFSNLDFSVYLDFVHELEKIKMSKAYTVILVDHSVGPVFRLMDEVLVLNQGTCLGACASENLTELSTLLSKAFELSLNVFQFERAYYLAMQR